MKNITSVQFVFAGEVKGIQGTAVKLTELVERGFFSDELHNDLSAEEVYYLLTSEATDFVYELLQSGEKVFVTSRLKKQKEAAAEALNRAVLVEIQNLARPFVQKRTLEGLQDMKLSDETKEMIAGMVNVKSNKEEKAAMENQTVSKDQVAKMMEAAGLQIGGVCFTPAGEGIVESFEATGDGVVVTVLQNDESKKFMAEKVLATAPKTMIAKDPEKEEVKGTMDVLRKAKAQINAGFEIKEDMTEAEIQEMKNKREDALAELKAEREALRGKEKAELANSSAARKILNFANGALQKGAKQTPKEEKGMSVNLKSAGVKEAAKEETRMGRPTRKLAVGMNIQSAGSTAAPKRERRGLRLQPDAVTSSGYVRYEGPWYLNRNWYEDVISPEEFSETRQNEKLGITDFKFYDPADLYRNVNPMNVAVIEVYFGAGVSFRFSIWESNQADAKEPIWSTNIGFESFTGRDGRRVFNRRYRFSQAVRNEDGSVASYENYNVSQGMNLNENVFAQVMTLAHWALGYEMPEEQ